MILLVFFSFFFSQSLIFCLLSIIWFFNVIHFPVEKRDGSTLSCSMDRFNVFPDNELIDIPFGRKYARSNNPVRVAVSRFDSL